MIKHIVTILIVCQWTLCCSAATTLQIQSQTPANNATVSSASVLSFQFNAALQSASLATQNLRFVRSGLDGLFGTPDDVAIALTADRITNPTPNELQISLAGLTLPDDQYRLVLDGSARGFVARHENYMSVPNFGQAIPAEEITVEFWQFFTGGIHHIPTTFGLEPNIEGNRFTLHSPWNSYDYLFWTFGTGETHAVQYVNTRGAWHHIAAVSSKAGNYSKLYVNGVLVGQMTSSASFTPYPAALEVPRAGPQPFLGTIDEFRVWNRERTPTEIAANYQRSLSGNEPGLLAYWNFNEGSGASVIDRSGHNHTGTLNSATPISWITSTCPIVEGISSASLGVLDGDADGTAGGFYVSNFTISGNVPAVLSTTPTNAATNVSEHALPAILFSETMNTGSVEAALSIFPAVAFTVQMNGNTATLTTPVLQFNTAYTVTVAATATDSSGTSLAAPYSFSFTTSVSPTIGSITPDLARTNSHPTLTVNGTGFRADAVVRLHQNSTYLQSTAVEFVSSTELRCIFDLTGAASGDWALEVRNSDVAPANVVSSTFHVTGLPTLTSVAPTVIQRGTAVPITLNGTLLPVFNGTATSSPTASFDGQNDRLVVASSALINSPQITIEAWVRKGFQIIKRNGSGFVWEQFFIHAREGEKVGWWLANGGLRTPAVSNTTLNGEWNHIACTYDGQTQRIYINGTLDGEQAVGWPIQTFNEAMYLYSEPFWDNTYTSGSMREFRFWNVARTQAQIAATMNVAHTTANANLILRYDFAAGPNATDTTGNGHTGVAEGGPSFGNLFPSSTVQVQLRRGSTSILASGPLTSTATMVNCQFNLNTAPYGLYSVDLIENGTVIATLPNAVRIATPDGLYAHYKFDEVRGTTAINSVSPGQDGTLINNPLRLSGKLNGALQFNGSNSYVSVANSTDLSDVGGFTVCAWIYRTGGTDQKFISKWNDNSNKFQFDFRTDPSGKLTLDLRQSNDQFLTISGTTTLNAQQWYHVAAGVNPANSQLELYVNGTLETLQGPYNWNGTIRSVDMEMNIGRKATGNFYWQGKIDDVRIYDHALNSTEIAALVSLTAPPYGPKVTGVTPTPNATITGPIQQIVANFNEDIDAATVLLGNVSLTGRGLDNQFGTSDDPIIVPAGIARSTSKQITLNLNGVIIPSDRYRLRLQANLKSSVGEFLDGEYTGQFPSGDGLAGGDFVSEFTISQPVVVPTAFNGSAIGNEDTPIAGTLVATHPQNAPLFYSVITGPTKGTLALQPNSNAYIYTPSENKNGTDSFTFVATDGVAVSNTATMTVIVTPVNDPPVAQSKSLTLTTSPVEIVDLSASDIDSSALTYAIFTQPLHGTLQLDTSSGTATYIANAGFLGADVFVYTVSDGTTSVQAAVQISVALIQPTFVSLPFAIPNPAVVRVPVVFSTEVQGVGPFNFTWTFASGIETGQTITKSFSPAAEYDVLLTVTDANGFSISKTLPFTIIAVALPGGDGQMDSDGDGFSDSMEIAMGTSPLILTETPLGSAARPSTPEFLRVSTLKIGLNFAKADRDTLSLNGALPIPEGLEIEDQKIGIDIGGLVYSWTLDSRAKAESEQGTFMLKLKKPQGKVVNQNALFKLSLTDSLAAGLANEGLVGTATVRNKLITIPLSIVFNGKLYESNRNVSYTAIKGKTGKAR